MAVTPDQLRVYLGAGTETTGDDLARWLTLAGESLSTALAGAFAQPSEAVMDELTLEVASEFARRRDSPNGAGQFATIEGQYPVRGPRDPLQQVRPILANYVTGF